MIASLTMYARPETDASIDVFWQLMRTALRDHGVSTPEILSQEANVMDVWTDPKLVIGQTCGMPFRKFCMGKYIWLAHHISTCLIALQAIITASWLSERMTRAKHLLITLKRHLLITMKILNQGSRRFLTTLLQKGSLFQIAFRQAGM